MVTNNAWMKVGLGSAALAGALAAAAFAGCGDDDEAGTSGGATYGAGGSGGGTGGTGGAPGTGGTGGGAPGTGGGGGGGAPGTGGAGGGGTAKFGEACTKTEDCAPNPAGEVLCFNFQAKGMLCTIKCPADPTKCPNGGQGCNNSDPKVCKPPA